MNMAQTKELCDVIETTLFEHSVDRLKKYLLSMNNSSDILNANNIKILMELLKKNGKKEDKKLHIKCVMICLDHILKDCIDENKWEIVAEDISKLYGVAFAISCYSLRDTELTDNIVLTVSEIVESITSLGGYFTKYMMESLMKAARQYFGDFTRIFVLITSLLEKSSREIRQEIFPSVSDIMKSLAEMLLEVGDYETQSYILEVFARFKSPVGELYKPTYFTNQQAQELFDSYRFVDFDTESRQFLNIFNDIVGKKERIYSVPSLMIAVDNSYLQKPNVPAYKNFWVDFNMVTRSISFYYEDRNYQTFELMSFIEKDILTVTSMKCQCKTKDVEGMLDAIKIEFHIKSDSSNKNLPTILRIYPCIPDFIEMEEFSILKKLFGDKYKSGGNSAEKETSPDADNRTKHNSCESNGKCQVKPSYKKSLEANHPAETQGSDKEDDYFMTEASSFDNASYDTQREFDLSKTQNVYEFESEDVRESELFSELIKRKKIEEASERNIKKQNSNETNIIKSIDEDIRNCESLTETVEIMQVDQNSSKAERKLNLDGNKSLGIMNNFYINSGLEQNEPSSCNSVQETDRHDHSTEALEESSDQKVRKLYSFESSGINNIMLSQDEYILNPPSPVYMIKNKEVLNKPKQNITKKSFTNKCNEDVTITSGKNYTEPASKITGIASSEIQESLLLNCECNSGQSDPSFLENKSACKSIKMNGLEELKSNIHFFSKKNDVENKNKIFKTKSKFQQEFLLPELDSPIKLDNRLKKKEKPKQKPILKKLKGKYGILQDDSSDSDYQPYKRKKGRSNSSQMKKIPLKRSDFQNSIKRNVMDPLRDDLLTPVMDLQPAVYSDDCTEVEMRELGKDLPLLQNDALPLELLLKSNNKNTKVTKMSRKKTLKKDSGKVQKPETRKRGRKKKSLEKLAENMTEFLDIVNYEPTDDQYKDAVIVFTDTVFQDETLQQTTFTLKDMVDFGISIMVNMKSKFQRNQELTQSERENILAEYDTRMQEYCDTMYGNLQNVETFADTVAKAKKLIDSALDIHKQVATNIQFESSAIQDASKDLLKELSNTEKKETSRIQSICQNFGSYLKQLVFSFVQKKQSISDVKT